jgi:hypothetical protein
MNLLFVARSQSVGFTKKIRKEWSGAKAIAL